MNIIFSIFIDIPENKLDNPGWYENGVQVKTDKSLNTKNALYNNRHELERRHKEYADAIGAKYILFEYSKEYEEFCELFNPAISEYDIINFYKHFLMYELSYKCDNVCYFDFDVVPNTTESIFDAFDMDRLCVAHSNDLAEWGKNIKASEYNTCIRNPSSKYWNAYAMLLEENHEPDNDVFNTGIMAASSKVIQKFDYFKDFDRIIELMTKLKHDKDSLYPQNIQRIFSYDNETVFSYLVQTQQTEIDWLPNDWHYIVDQPTKEMIDTRAKLYHVINKQFELVL
ncbi:hypothetical protein N9X90_04790 [Alphaproteobacteria bacterium]|nr:hypothetical protein [Alphaproteobacteria bacterium]